MPRRCAGVQVSLVGVLGLTIAALNLKSLSVMFSAISFFSLLIQIALVSPRCWNGWCLGCQAESCCW